MITMIVKINYFSKLPINKITMLKYIIAKIIFMFAQYHNLPILKRIVFRIKIYNNIYIYIQICLYSIKKNKIK